MKVSCTLPRKCVAVRMCRGLSVNYSFIALFPTYRDISETLLDMWNFYILIHLSILNAVSIRDLNSGTYKKIHRE